MKKEQQSSKTLNRVLGLPSLTFYGVGMILGAGIYSVIGKAAGHAGEALWLSFVLSAIVALLTGLSYAELSAMFPEAGGGYSYLAHTFQRRRFIPFLAGSLIVLINAGTAATVALAFAGYLANFLQIPDLVAGAILLILLTATTIVGIRESSWFNILLTLIEASGLMVIIAYGAKTPAFGDSLAFNFSYGVLPAAALVFFSYLGFENIVNLAEEAKQPARDLPRAIFISLGVTTVIYVLVALSAVALADPQELAQSNSPLAKAVERISTRAAQFLAAVALCSTANTALVALVSGSRVFFSMARRGDMPKKAAVLLPKRRTPWLASGIVLGLAVLLLLLKSISITAGVTALSSLLVFILLHVALILLRFREPTAERPFRVPLPIKSVPLPAMLGIGVSLALLFHFEWMVYGIQLVVMGLIGLGYWLKNRG